MEERCRVCLGTTGEFTSIFDETTKWDTRIADMISECTGFVVERGDSFPENICPPCLEDAVSAFDLKKTCEQSHHLHFSYMEKDNEEGIWSEVWEVTYFEPVDIHQNDTDKTDDLEGPYQCAQCSKNFSELKHLAAHIRDHTQVLLEHKCTDCSKAFATSTKLKAHARSHMDPQLLKCDICQKSYSTLGTLKTHYRIHTGERPYPCTSHCSRAFATKARLKAHILALSGELPFKCPHCSETFRSKRKVYQRHLQTHTGNEKCAIPAVHSEIISERTMKDTNFLTPEQYLESNTNYLPPEQYLESYI
ncbi:zinc finger and BTB domain-containing protein 17-like [Drosophila madeirensis]|uniref:Zinc finger and BTB domain-containing protein 17-like n=1 Tax=Drosophila madeirensis TaxID=30013 RepID=A0AAU9FHM1_DROMD